MANTAVAFFFFDFSDPDAQHPNSMLRSIINQLYNQVERSREIAELLEVYKHSALPGHILLQMLDLLLQKCHHTFAIIDALDECSDPLSLIRHLNEIRSWHREGLHILVTSRCDVDFRLRINYSPGEEILVEDSVVDKDIGIWLDWRFDNDMNLQKWVNDFDLIRDSLLQGAQGMLVIQNALI